jgi:outer membrane receptor protein involved in Fe transport
VQTRLAPRCRIARAIFVALLAASPGAPPNSDIEEIVILGAESEAAQDFEAADSVTGFGAEDLAAIGAQDIADLAEFTPNLEIVTSGATTPTFFIRGVGLNDFNANSTGAVAIYQDDVAINAPALQLGTLFDVEAVNVLRGPQGTGLARNASAGAIKIYSRKPTGEFGGFLRSDFGNFNFRDFEGAVEAPIYEDLLAGRFAFRLTQRDGTMKNRCSGAPPPVVDLSGENGRVPRPLGGDPFEAPWSHCAEPVQFSWDPFDFTDPPFFGSNIPENWDGISEIPTGLPDYVNNTNNWAARGTLLFQPTLDVSMLLNAHGSRRDELTRLGQAYGTGGPDGFFIEPDGTFVDGVLGGQQVQTSPGYTPPEVKQRRAELEAAGLSPNDAKIQLAKELARDLDSKPWEGDFNVCSTNADVDDDDSNGIQCPSDAGRTQNDTWGGYLNADIALPAGIQLKSVTGYDTYDRMLDTDIDFSPETLFHIRTDDDGWQVVQDLRLQGDIGDESRIRWDVGGWFLRERLNVLIDVDLGEQFGVNTRDYVQDLWSAAGFASLSFDFWDRFTLDGGVRYNWERKTLDYLLTFSTDPTSLPAQLDETWSAPTGMVRLTYRFREDTHVFWKYSRGWKPGTFNATSNALTPLEGGRRILNLSVADPETIDAFETGVRGSWLEGRLGADFSFFYYDYKNYQLFVAQQFAVAGAGVPEFVILNAAGAEVYGAELDLVGRPWIGAFLNVRIGWLESQFLDFVQIQQKLDPRGGGGTVNVEVQNTGNRLLNSPQFKMSMTAEQTIPLGRWGSMTGRYDGVWTDTTYYDATEGRGVPNDDNIEFLPEDTIGQRAFWQHNVRLSYRPPNVQVEIAAWGRNLANKPYKTFAFDGTSFTKTTLSFVGDPRTFGASMMLTF